jgi:4-amino-4-deoxy-L-arabinose transferase-like glycosyltransferase
LTLTPLVSAQRTTLLSRKATLLLAGFLLVRLSLVLVIANYLEGGVLIDSRGYLRLSDNLVRTGDYLDPDRQDLIWPPGYPLFVAAVSGWSDFSPMRVAFAQLLVTSAVAVMLVYLVGRLEGPAAGALAGWAYALSPNAGLWSLTVMSETLFAALLALACLLWIRSDGARRIRWALAAGLALGAATMVRPIGLVLIPLWALLTYLRFRVRDGRQTALRLGAAVLVGAGLWVGPWSLRNLLVRGEFTFSNVSARTFYSFNVAQVLAEVEGISRDDAATRLAVGQDPQGESLALIRQYPALFVRAQVQGILRSTLGVESGVWARLLGLPIDRQGSLGVLGTLLSGDVRGASEAFAEVARQPDWAAILALSIAGLGFTLAEYGLALGSLFAGRRRPWLLLLLLLSVAVLLVSPGAAGQARFRIPAEPFLAVLAAMGWVGWRSRGKRDTPQSDAVLGGSPS